MSDTHNQGGSQKFTIGITFGVANYLVDASAYWTLLQVFLGFLKGEGAEKE